MRTAELAAAFEVLLASTNPRNRVDIPHTRHTISRKAMGAGVHRSDAYAARKASGGKDKRVGVVEIDFNLLAPVGKPVTQEDQAGRDDSKTTDHDVTGATLVQFAAESGKVSFNRRARL